MRLPRLPWRRASARSAAPAPASTGPAPQRRVVLPLGFSRRLIVAEVIIALLGGALFALLNHSGHSRHLAGAAGRAATPRPSQSPPNARASGTSGPQRSVTLPLDRAVAQLFLIGFAGTDARSPLLASLRARDWGGVVLDSSNFVDTHQLSALTGLVLRTVAQARHTSPFVVARQAGGSESTFANLPPDPQVQQGNGGRSAVAQSQAIAAARALSRLGVNMNLAPDGDLAYEGGVGGDRAFSSDPAVVVKLTASALRGYRMSRVISVPGPFPGEGAAAQDPAYGVASVGLSLAQLRARDLEPFAAVVGQAPAIQLSDALFTALDPVTPATLSAPAIALLRHGLGYRGVIISGDLQAASAAGGASIGRDAVDALRAGADMLYISGDAAAQDVAFRAVLAAVRSGQLSQRQLTQSLARELALKRAYRLAR